MFFGFLSLIGGLERLGLRFFSEGGLSLTADECDYALALCHLEPEPIIKKTGARVTSCATSYIWVKFRRRSTCKRSKVFA